MLSPALSGSHSQFNLVTRSAAQSKLSPPTTNVSSKDPDLLLLFKLHWIWSADFQESIYSCYQMSYCNAKRTEFDFGWGSSQTLLLKFTALPRTF